MTRWGQEWPPTTYSAHGWPAVCRYEEVTRGGPRPPAAGVMPHKHMQGPHRHRQRVSEGLALPILVVARILFLPHLGVMHVLPINQRDLEEKQLQPLTPSPRLVTRT